jgi:hypothetical protein
MVGNDITKLDQLSKIVQVSTDTLKLLAQLVGKTEEAGAAARALADAIKTQNLFLKDNFEALTQGDAGKFGMAIGILARNTEALKAIIGIVGTDVEQVRAAAASIAEVVTAALSSTAFTNLVNGIQNGENLGLIATTLDQMRNSMALAAGILKADNAAVAAGLDALTKAATDVAGRLGTFVPAGNFASTQNFVESPPTAPRRRSRRDPDGPGSQGS